MKFLFLILLFFIGSLSSAQRVVSLLPSATQIAQQIGADANVVGRTAYCPKPQPSTRSSLVGDAMTVNVEAIIALRPDLVIVSPFTKSGVVDRLKSLGIKTLSLPTPADFNEICSQALTIGQVTGHASQAEALVSDSKRRLGSILSSFAQNSTLSFYVQIGTNPLWGATPDYYIGDIITLLGGRNVLGLNDGPCSREAVLVRKPDVIIVSSLGGLGDDEAAIWLRLTKARVAVVPQDELCCPTPLFFVNTVERIVAALK